MSCMLLGVWVRVLQVGGFLKVVPTGFEVLEYAVSQRAAGSVLLTCSFPVWFTEGLGLPQQTSENGTCV